MKKNLAFILLSISTIFSFAQTSEKNFIDLNYIEVTGIADKEIIPDQIYLSISIIEKNIENRETIESIEKRMIEKLKALGIDVAKNLSLQDFSGNYQSFIFKRGELNSKKDFVLLVNSAKVVSKVFIELDKIGISSVYVLKVDHSKIEDFKKEVKVMAVKNAKDKADAITGALNQTIGKAIYILESNPFIYQQPRYAKALMQVSATSEDAVSYDSPIEFEKIKLEYNLLVRFELK